MCIVPASCVDFVSLFSDTRRVPTCEYAYMYSQGLLHVYVKQCDRSNGLGRRLKVLKCSVAQRYKHPTCISTNTRC